LLLFSSPFVVLINYFYPNTPILPFPSDSPPHPIGTGGGVRGQLHGSLFLAGAKPQQEHSKNFIGCKNDA